MYNIPKSRIDFNLCVLNFNRIKRKKHFNAERAYEIYTKDYLKYDRYFEKINYVIYATADNDM